MHHSFKLILLFISFSFIFGACHKNETKRGMYFWKVNQNITNEDASFLINNNIENYYVRYFDVGWDARGFSIPKGLLNEKSTNNNIHKFEKLIDSLSINENTSVIPVVYIENEVMSKLVREKMGELVNNISSKIKEISNIEFPNCRINEIQIDCDWSEKSKDNYFEFLKMFKEKNNNKLLSVTIRLHQIKFPEITGIPPVDKGTLMYYNMGKIKDPTEGNSILNNDIAKQYIDKKTKYPLDLSLALPIYSWSVWFSEGEFKTLLYTINSKNIKDYSFLKQKDKIHYQCIQDTLVAGNYFRKGDVFRLEEQTIKDIEEAKEICKPLLNKKTREIIIFSYSPENSKLINHEDFNSIYHLD